jgi:hypothetical protein
MNKHNKKRNVGIVYEQLLRFISERLVKDDKRSAQAALNIIERRFNKQTEIYKEFRLFKALAQTTVSDTPVAAAILTEAKSAARRLDNRQLDIEKSQLIKEINYTLGIDFYDRKIPEYKDFATIQTLLNDWQMGDRADLSRVVQFESKIIEKLLDKKVVLPPLEEQKDPGADRLVVKIMTEKMNQKWSDRLNNEQREILKTYAFHTDAGSQEKLRESLRRVKDGAIRALAEFRRTNSNPILMEKIDAVTESVRDIDLAEVNDDTIAKLLTISQMKSEIMSGVKDE